MADTSEDFVGSDVPQNLQCSQDDLFSGINFNDVVDPVVIKDFESRLAQDFPVRNDPAEDVPARDGPVQDTLGQGIPARGVPARDVPSQDVLPNYGEALTYISPQKIQGPVPPVLPIAKDNETLYLQPPQLANTREFHNTAQVHYVPQNFPPNTNSDWLGEGGLLENQFISDLHNNVQPHTQAYSQYLPVHTQQLPQLVSPTYWAAQPASQYLPPLCSILEPPNQNLPARSTSPIVPAVGDRRDSYLPPPINRSRHSSQPPPPETVTTSPPVKRPARDHHGDRLLDDKIPRKTHSKKGPLEVEPERYYGPSPAKPRSWGPRNEKGEHLFTYTEKGELSAGLFFTAKEMRQYLLGPGRDDYRFDGPYRLPGVKYLKKKIRQGLTLWIGWPAAMANARYPRGGESTKCRFKNCRYSKAQTINVGEPWVIMDERQNVDGELINPFHNAGYCHLWCLEHYFDIISLWHCIDVRADYRNFKRESYPYFSLEHKLPGIARQVREWWASAYSDWVLASSWGRRRPRSHKTSLTQRLVDFKLLHEPTAQARNRRKRCGLDMSKHRGDPDLKRKLMVYKSYGLLDENGNPVPNAEELCDEIENPNKRARKESDGDVDLVYASFAPLQQPLLLPPAPAPPPCLPTTLVNNDCQFYPMTNPEPVNPPNYEELYTAPSNEPRITMAIENCSPKGIAVEGANIPATEPAVPTNPGQPSLKRQRAEADPPGLPHPSIRTSPKATQTNILDSSHGVKGDIDGELFGNSTETGAAFTDAFEMAGSAGVDQELDDATLNEIFGVSETVLDNGKPVGDADGCVVEESAPATSPPVLGGEECHSDHEFDDLFGEPES